MIATIAEDVHDVHDAQPWSSRRLVLTFDRSTESVSAISSALRGFGEMKESVDLGHGAIDAPARAHFAPVEDEFFGDGSKGWHGVFCNFCQYSNYSNPVQFTRTISGTLP